MWTRKEVTISIVGISIGMLGFFVGGDNFSAGFFSMAIVSLVMDELADEEDGCEWCEYLKVE